MRSVRRMLKGLVREIRARHRHEPYSEYTKGYLDACRYTIEWIEEQDEFEV